MNEFDSDKYSFAGIGKEYKINLAKYNSMLPDPKILTLHVASEIANEIVIAFMNKSSVILDFSDASFTKDAFPSGTGFCKIINILNKYYSREVLNENIIILAYEKQRYLYEYIYFDKYRFLNESEAK